MRAKAVHICPIWEEPNGFRRPGISYEPNHPPVVGWCNVMDLEIDGERHLLLLVL